MTRRALATRALDASLAADAVVGTLTLSLLWALTSATVVGAPAATAALAVVTAERARKDERPVAALYLAALRRTWAPATLVGLVVAVLAALTLADLVAASAMGGARWAMAGAVVAVALPAALVVAVVPLVLAGAPDRAPGLRRTVALSARLAVARPLLAATSLAAGTAVVAACALVPPLLLILPAPAARLVRAMADHPLERTPA